MVVPLLFLKWNGVWDGKVRKILYMFMRGCHFTSRACFTNLPTTDVVKHQSGPSQEFVELDGAEFGESIKVLGEWTRVSIQLNSIFQNMIERNFFEAPLGGLETIQTTKISIGLQTKAFTLTNAADIYMELTNYKIGVSNLN